MSSRLVLSDLLTSATMLILASGFYPDEATFLKNMHTLFTVVFLSLSIGLSLSLPKESISTESNDTAVNCTFSKNVLSCQYQVESVECDAFSNIVNLTVLPLQIFGMGALDNDSVSNSESVKISLFPRVLDLPVYLLNSIKVDGEIVNMSLYYSLSDTDTGVRITDKECFTRMLNFFKNVQELHRVSVQQNLLGDSQDLDLFGLLVINNPNARKIRQPFGSNPNTWSPSSYSNNGGYGGYSSSYSSNYGSSWGSSFGYGK
ncbi:hypothetical protein BpHYR1_003098 [Brachionus plicatilis]|uniref:Uncharacterized protein n=1 Tax=Brachionus plicatilis TaxID=10195 RepID=A0A3M7SJC0_BRAPC|nr:hypothetical protein BpHYR1_003098 [Brachionus plicatilis]